MNPSALMGGMPPGAGGPNAHAMQHLSPAQAQMFQTQHLNPMACKFRTRFCCLLSHGLILIDTGPQSTTRPPSNSRFSSSTDSNSYKPSSRDS